MEKTEKNAPDVRELCVRLDGLPLPERVEDRRERPGLHLRLCQRRLPVRALHLQELQLLTRGAAAGNARRRRFDQRCSPLLCVERTFSRSWREMIPTTRLSW